MTIQEFYLRVGGSWEDTLRRLPGEAFVRRFLLRYLQDPSFDQLERAVEGADWEAAFRAAHTLKGVAQNLGLGDLYQAAAGLTEALRPGRPLEDPEALAAVRAAQERAVEAIREM